jgi:hypothetical protein
MLRLPYEAIACRDEGEIADRCFARWPDAKGQRQFRRLIPILAISSSHSGSIQRMDSVPGGGLSLVIKPIRRPWLGPRKEL